MRRFKHLTKTMRLKLEALLRTNTPIKDIADILDVHISTIYREIKKGTYEHLNAATWETEIRYSCDIAQENYIQNLKAKGADLKINNDYKLANYIEKRIIKDHLSPSAVLGEIKAKGLEFK